MGITSLNFDDWIEWYSQISRPETLMQLGAIALAGREGLAKRCRRVVLVFFHLVSLSKLNMPA